jgi:hypothetical protein
MNKRHFLKGVGLAAGSLAFPYGQVTAAVTNRYEGEQVLLTPSPENALSASEAFAIQRETVQEFRSKSDISEDVPIGISYPSEDSKIVALSFRVDEAGQASIHMGAVPRDQSISQERAKSLHQTAQEHAEEVADEVDPKRADRDMNSGVASANYATGWDQMVSHYSYEYDDCPYGSLYLGGEVYEKEGTSYWGYGVDHVHRSNPGANACGSSYVVNDAYSRHDWDYYEAGDPTVHEYHPDSDRNGNFSVDGSVSFSGGSISVSYNPPDVYRDVKAQWDGNQKVQWDWDYTYDPDTPAQHKPASVTKSPERATKGIQDSDRLLQVLGGANFLNYGKGNHLTEYSAIQYVE